MAEVSQRAWKIPGQRTKRLAWGYTVMIGGKRRKSYHSEWTKEQAEAELAKVLLQIEEKPKQQGAGITLKEAVDQYLLTKARKKSLAFDKLYLNQLKAAFGAETPLAEITA